jgi:hypothetical protein
VVEPHLLGVDAEASGEAALEPDRDIAQAEGAMSLVARLTTTSAMPSTIGTVRRALAKPPGPVVS